MLKQPEKFKSLPSVRDTLKIYGIKPDKKLGQNFLFDVGITDQIVLAAGDLTNKTILEVGPGPGALTRSILASPAKKVYAAEMDTKCINALRELERLSDGRLEVLHKDAVQLIESDLTSDKIQVIANLPYNIGTVLIFKWLDNIHLFSGFILMLQKEVVERICAKTSSHDYGKLSIMVQIKAKVESVFDVDPEYFFPAPKVVSSIIRITPYSTPPYKYDEARLQVILKAAFGQRRKMLRTTLSSIFPNHEEVLTSVGVSSTSRAQDVTPEQFCKLSLI